MLRYVTDLSSCEGVCNYLQARTAKLSYAGRVAEVVAAFDKVKQQLGHPEVLIYNAGPGGISWPPPSKKPTRHCISLYIVLHTRHITQSKLTKMHARCMILHVSGLIELHKEQQPDHTHLVIVTSTLILIKACSHQMRVWLYPGVRLTEFCVVSAEAC